MRDDYMNMDTNPPWDLNSMKTLTFKFFHSYTVITKALKIVKLHSTVGNLKEGIQFVSTSLGYVKKKKIC